MRTAACLPPVRSKNLFRTFMVYVANSGRPMHELLAPAAPLSEELYREEFVGMTRQPVSWDTLIETRRHLHADISSRLTSDIAAFLLSLHDAEPDFRHPARETSPRIARGSRASRGA